MCSLQKKKKTRRATDSRHDLFLYIFFFHKAEQYKGVEFVKGIVAQMTYTIVVKRESRVVENKKIVDGYCDDVREGNIRRYMDEG